MGDLKALLHWGGQTLIGHQIEALSSAGVSRIVVVLGHQSDRLESLLRGRPGVECVYNPDYRQGKTTSLKAGLAAVRGSAVEGPPEDFMLLLNVDQPRSAGIVRRVIELHHSGPHDPAPRSHLITVPTYGGKGGHPIALSTTLMPELIDISEDTMGLKAVVRRHAEDTVRVEVDAPEILLDLNTPDDYRKALEHLTS